MQTAQELKKHKCRLISHKTPEELYVLNSLKLIGMDVKFQMILGFYIMDFILPSKMVNIEVDGGIHSKKKKYDYLRDIFTRKCGFSVIRIKNEDIFDFDYSSLLQLPDFSEKVFKRGLSLGNVNRGKAILRQKN